MTNTAQNILSAVITFVISRTLYWAAGFYPVENLPAIIGTIVDIIIWIVLYLMILWVVGKTLSNQRETQ